MLRIQKGHPHHTVIVTLDGTPDVVRDLQAHAEEGLSQFRRYPGFVGGALHRSTDGGRLVQYLQWQSVEEYRACIEDPTWEDLPSTSRFLRAVETGEVSLDERAYSVVRSSEGG